MADTPIFASYHLSGFQNAFVEQFLLSESRPYQLLLAPPGGGKTTVSQVIVLTLAKSTSRRILILTESRNLINHYRQIFDGAIGNKNTFVIDRKLAREIEALDQPDTVPLIGIALTTWDSASHDDVRRIIFTTAWDLVIAEVDQSIVGINSMSTFGVVLNTLFNTRLAKRILVLADPNEAPNIQQVLGVNFDQLEVTIWKEENYPTLSEPVRGLRFMIIGYERTKEEVAFVKQYIGLSKLLSNRNLQNRIRSGLVSSSLYAAEQSLRTFRNQLVHHNLDKVLELKDLDTGSVDNDELPVEIDFETPDKERWSADNAGLLLETMVILNGLDQVRVDSKYNALVTALRDLDLRNSHVWIHSSYQLTISYLHSSLGETLSNVYQIHGGMSSRDVDTSAREFDSSGGILIASATALKGIELPVNILILYDVPATDRLVYVALTRLTNPSNSATDKDFTMVAFNDRSGVIAWEARRIQKLQDIAETTTSR